MALSGFIGDRNYLHGKSALLELSGNRVSANLFRTLGVEPELGRDFLPETQGFARGKNAGTIVLSDAVWRTAFNADRSILGQQVKINDDTYTVVGVMPPGFQHPLPSPLPTSLSNCLQSSSSHKPPRMLLMSCSNWRRERSARQECSAG
jgi:hypothetical protein